MATSSSQSEKAMKDESFFTSDEFIARSMSFLARYQWIYDFQLTQFLSDRVWENIPSEWIEVLCSCSVDELNNIPYGLFEHDWPASLCEFIQETEALSLQRNPDVELVPVNIAQESKRGMKPKKVHEVGFMATLVHNICQETKCSNIVDVGAGLGYLSHTLHQKCGYKVLALECEESRTHGAENRASKLDLTGMASATFHLEKTQESFDEFQKLMSSTFRENQGPNASVISNSKTSEIHQASNVKNDCDIIKHDCDAIGVHSIQEKGDSNYLRTDDAQDASSDSFIGEALGTDSLMNNVCMIGLHCCGPLTPAMLELFLNCESVRSLAFVSCCYHSMPIDDEGECLLFPLSSAFKHIYMKTKESFRNWKIGKFALRLAAQETRARWKSQSKQDHDYHSKNVAYRAILEIFSKDNETLMKQKRRIAHKKDYENFDTYLDAIFTRTTLSSKHQYDLRSIHEEYEQYFKFIEPFTALQVLLQPVLESLIYADRLTYLREHGILNSSIVPIFNESISPRNLAIVAVK